eukprot:TRINITY_DN12185_c0_g1_i1.p1 TRINITY_DN12185_c0_g1~~TRINITY_DN12185_c0_g1_i1.p1  ORF type:complete len:307 (+),score=71.71 TRINITY_DN12185_c0_g1_i1:94-1014(+)
MRPSLIQPASFALLAVWAEIALANQCSPEHPDACHRYPMDKTPTPCLKEYDDATHKSIIAQHLHRAKENQDPPQMIVMVGGSGAGKGTFLKAVRLKGFPIDDYVNHGLDEYIGYLSEFRRSVSDPTRVFKDAADDCYGGVIPIAKAAQKQMIEKKQNVIYEDTGKNLDRLIKRVITPFKDAGYRVTMVLVDNTPKIAKERAWGRFIKTGRFASDEYIDGTYKNVFENYHTMKDSELVSESYYCDNSCLMSAPPPQNEEYEFGHELCLRCWEDSKTTPEKGLLPTEVLQTGPVVHLATHHRSSKQEL